MDQALPESLTDYFAELSKHTQARLQTDAYTRLLYSTDASIYQVIPYGVFFPENPDDVQAAVELASSHAIPILPRTSGSSLVGQAINKAVIIDMSRHLDQVLELNVEEHWVRVQSGMVLDELNLYLKPHGLQFGPDPASSNRAAMGGIVSNNSTGAHSILYGMTADHVIDMNVVLSDGSQTYFAPLERRALESQLKRSGLEGDIYRRIDQIARDHRGTILAGTPHHWRRCGGYNLDRFVDGANFKVPADPRFNLARIVSGAEGTLAVIQDVKLNLVPVPGMTAIAVLHFESLPQALGSVPAILEANPSAIELLDNLALRMCREVPEYSRLLKTFMEGDPNCLLFTEFYGSSESELKSLIDGLESHLQRQGIRVSVVPAISSSLQNNIWTVRKVGLGLLMSIKGDHKPIPFIEDAAVPVEYLAEYVSRVERFCNSIGSQVAYYAHASAGCIHIRPLINTKAAEDVAKLPEISRYALSLVMEYRGSLSSEHGDGRARSWLNREFFGPELYSLYQEVKRAFDPQNILNPGNLVDAGPMTENLRFGAGYQAMPIRTSIDFSADLGFDRAVEMCNGAGICRKRTAGTMCPSFMVTREEEHSTRGRANALRAAISGLIPPEELTSPRMFQVMDLCVECKACKAECPSSVDMAKIKFEFLNQYYRVHTPSLRSRMFADFPRISRFNSGALAPLANLTVGATPVRWGLEKTLGISSRRRMPEFAREPFQAWARKRSIPGVSVNGTARGGKPQVALFNDTFNNFNSPGIAQAAFEVLEAAGYDVIVPDYTCCGRPSISKGFADKAREAARQTVNFLNPLVSRGIPVVGLEPSCILTFRDEYLYLLPGDRAARELADQSFTFEEFIANLNAR
ncbi:MAG TPA: FAD-linked oxidase C-terminal domain-containing protein, partial [Anaerolineales bacterium]|nr:FAD-linked oxidase C-terminal domain-containing protein [Anaerolineales bacterium]